MKNKTLSFCDYIQSNDFDVVAITETWLGSRVDKTCLNELVPNGYQIKHVPRGGGGKRGGGVGIIHKSEIDVRSMASSVDNEFLSFEYLDCNLSMNNHSVRLAIVYRPPPTKENGFKIKDFLE